MKVATFGLMIAGLILFAVGVFTSSGVVWIGFGLLVLAGLLSLWIKWGPTGWGWQARRARRG